MPTHIWRNVGWKDFYSDKNVRTGLRMRYDADVPLEVKRACQEFAKWLHREFYFPIRVPVYMKKQETIVASDGDHVSALFFEPYDRMAEPRIKVATGDYYGLVRRNGKYSALAVTLCSIAHELTHYFQWVNQLGLSDEQAERQARRYARSVVEQYIADSGRYDSLDPADNAEVLDADSFTMLSPPCEPSKIWTEFCFCFDWDFRIDTISEILQLAPYEAARQADTRGNPLTGEQNPGYWEFRTTPIRSFDCEDALNELQNFIQTHRGSIHEVLARYAPCKIITRLEIECAPTGDTPAIRLEPALLEMLNDIHATLDIDIDVLTEE